MKLSPGRMGKEPENLGSLNPAHEKIPAAEATGAEKEIQGDEDASSQGEPSDSLLSGIGRLQRTWTYRGEKTARKTNPTTSATAHNPN